MHAVGYRPRLSFVVLAFVTLAGIGALTASTRSRSCSGKWRSSRALKVDCSQSRAVRVAQADAWYRTRNFAFAEQALRDAAACEQPKVAEELHVIASFYRQLGTSWASLTSVAYRDREVHIDAMLQLDAMLGGAHADELSYEKQRILWAVGPQ
jgi:hypothetical protein